MSKILRYQLIAFLVFLAVAMQQRTASASHAMGADLTYECLGGNTYLLRVSFYRDCIGIAAPNNVFVNVRSNSCGQNLGITCYPIPGTGQEVTPVCPTAVTSCNGGIYTGIQEWVYEGVITLPMQCTDWVFSYNLCCRNAAINTITSPNSNTFYIYATLNNIISPCNSSPTFSNKPVPFACVGQEYCFNHGAYDADGDSLVYSLITPYQNATTTVNYIPPFTPTNPLTSSPAVTFNTATGDICMTPQNLEVTVMAVLVQEYRNGVLIGSVERDIQITVLSCNNNLPTLTGINGTNTFNATVCAGQQLCFFINSADADANQTVEIDASNTIPGATFTSTGGTRPTGNFCWTPSQSDISNNPYCFTVRVYDDACPMVGSQIYSYCINVIGINVNAGPDQMIACNDQATVSVTASGGTGNYTYLWSNGVTLPIQTVGEGTYIVTVSDGICTNQDTVNVISAFEPTAAFTAAGTCPGLPIQFTDQSTLPGGFITSWNWQFGDGDSSSVQNPSHVYAGPGTYNAALIIETSLGCIDTILQPVVITAPPVAAFTVAAGCAGSSISVNNTTSPAGNVSWNWDFGNGQTSTSQNPSITYTNPGTYNITLIAGDTLGCADTLVQQVIINPLPTAAFTASAIVCQGGSITFTDNSQANGGTITSWNWNFGNGQTSTTQNPVITFPASGNYDVTLTVTNSNGCSSTYLQTIPVNPLPVASAGSSQVICVGGTATLVASGGVTYLWSPGGMTTDIINVSPSGNTSYTVTVTDANGCTASATANVTVNSLPVINVTPAQSICAGQSVTLTATGGISYSWSPSGNTTGTISVSPASSTTYAVTGTNANGCTATAFVNVNVNPLPVVNLSNVFICTGVNAVLNAGNTGSAYQWSNGQNSQSITVNTAGIYSVTVTNTAGCTGSDSSIVSQSGTIVNSLQNVAFCAGGNAVLDAGNPGNSYLWSNGSTSQTITVSNAGAYSVTITDANGCSGILSTTVNVNPVPVAQFTPNDVCINDLIQFANISTISSGSITSWSWDFGDGNVSQQQNPSHIYPVAGAYNVSLIVTSNTGCTDTITKTFNVFPLPQANFNYLNGCAMSPVQFTNSSITTVGNITGWQWLFGDGTSSSNQNPSHAYSSPGIYNVQLLITTAGGCVDSISKPVTISALPVAAFNATQPCRGTPVQFTSSSTVPGGVLSSWSWDFGNGQTSGLQNPSNLYNNAGTFPVSLIVTSNNGCVDTIIQPLTVNPLPPADAGAPQSICRGENATLTATGGTSYLWNTGNTTASITVSPSTTTSYYVTVTDANGCQARDSVRLTIRPLPVATAGPDRSVCVGSTTTLTGGGAPNIVWNPGNLNSANIVVNPTVTTNYIVTATATNGCSSTDTVTVTVNPLPVANAGPDQMICEGTTATITATGGISYYWSTTGATTQSIYPTPVLPGIYAVQVTDVNGCKDWDSVSVGINPTPTANLAPAFLCVGTSTILNAGNPGSTYLWSPNGETTQTITVSDSGFYDVIIISPNGCVGYAGVDVFMGGTAIVSNPTNLQICDGSTTLLNASNPGASYLWSTGATSQSIPVSTAGSYTVTITDVSGCSASFTSNVSVNPNPVVNFSAASACVNTNILFNNSTTVASGNVTSWLWNFGNGSNSTSQNPVNLYSGAGNYNVTLTATTGAGCTASVTNPVTVYPQPAAAFASTSVCFGNPNQFTNNSTIASGTISTWQWSFGNGITSALQNPSPTYAAPGVYDVTLVAGSGFGCTDTVTSQVTVYDAPVVQFAWSNVCDGTDVSFTNASTINDGTISSYAWIFGDGGTSAIQDPRHLYSAPGTYNVTLNVLSDLGCPSSVTQPVTIFANPVISVSANNVCDGSNATFNSTIAVAGANVNSIYWNFGDGGSSNLQNPSHLYNTSGTYPVYMVVMSDQGCTDTVATNVTVHPLPAVNFTTADACLYDQAVFTNQSTISSGSIVSHIWSFGDGNLSAALNPVHNYTTPGSYQVNLTSTSIEGCIDSSILSVNIYPVPVADFTKADVCQGNVSAFFNQSQVQGGGIINCSWNFGDGNVSLVENPQHTYASPGTYTVTLIATTLNGCSDTITRQVTIFPVPAPAFFAQNACDGEPVSFIDQSVSVNGAISTWSWNFGDGTTSTSASPYHDFPGPGNYPVTLTITSLTGCTSSITDTVSVYNLPVPMISVNANCVYDPASFNSITAIGDTLSYQYLWTFGDGASSNLQNPEHLYAVAGNFQVTLQMINPNGCSATATSMVDLSPVPNADFNYNDVCAESAVTFNNTSTISSGTIISYSWNFGDGSPLSGAISPSHSYTTPGVYSVTLIAVSNNGCVDTLTQQITIFNLPVADFTNNQDAGCGPLTIQFTDASFIASGNIVSWNWNFGNGQVSQLQNPVATYTENGTYSVTLTVTSDMGCTHTFTQSNLINVYPGPQAAFIAEPQEAGILNPVISFNNTSVGAVIHTWTFGDGTSSSLSDPVHTYPDTGTYLVTLLVQNSYGCIDTVSQYVHIVPEFTLFIPNAFTPNDDGVNDIFSVSGIGIEEITLNIFNRWGENIYTSNKQGWNGIVQKDNGKAQQDVYVYDVTALDVFGRKHRQVGRVTLVR